MIVDYVVQMIIFDYKILHIDIKSTIIIYTTGGIRNSHYITTLKTQDIVGLVPKYHNVSIVQHLIVWDSETVNVIPFSVT